MNVPSGAPTARVVIIGGGPIGMACALMMAQRGLACALVDARTLEQARADRRLLALSRGTLDLLAAAVGRPPAPLASILQVHVSSAGQLGSARLTSRDFKGQPLGATVWYADLVETLAQAAQHAYAALIDRYRGAAYRYLLADAGSDEAVELATAETGWALDEVQAGGARFDRLAHPLAQLISFVHVFGGTGTFAQIAVGVSQPRVGHGKVRVQADGPLE